MLSLNITENREFITLQYNPCDFLKSLLLSLYYL